MGLFTLLWRSGDLQRQKKLTGLRHSISLQKPYIFRVGGRVQSRSLKKWSKCGKQVPQGHPIRLAAEHEFAHFRGLQGDPEKATKLFTHAIDIRRKISSNNAQRELLTSQYQLARTNLHDGQVDEASARFRKVLEIYEKHLPETHAEILATQHEIGC